MKKVILEKGREKSLQRRHPWIFSGAVKQVEGKPERGETVDIVSAGNDWLGRGSYSPDSQITVRVWTFNKDENIDRDFFRRQIVKALEFRQKLSGIGTDFTAYRIIAAEADGLPGLIADRYGDYLVVQFLASGVELHKQLIIELLAELTACKSIYERSDVAVRLKEGLTETAGLLFGEEPPEKIEIREHAQKFYVDVRHGHKTGFYLDQRDNRATVAGFAGGKDVLNAFAYTGGFGIAALMAGAKSAVHVDLSGASLELARANAERNGLDAAKSEFVEGNVFEVLRKFRDARRSFDLVVLDPPKFVESKGHLMAASRGYKDINLLGLKLLRPGGILATFSCSGLMPTELFQKIVTDAACDARREVQLLQRLEQASDHAESLMFPEGLYLKGLLCRVR